MAACGAEAPHELVTLDPCTPVRVSGAGADGGLATWGLAGRGDGPIDLAVVRASGGGGVELGFYDDVHATIDISDTLDDDVAAIVIAHELGHAFGLVHVPATERTSVMNPGNATIAPTAADRTALGCAVP